MNYKIAIKEIGEYIEYLVTFRKRLEKDLNDFDKAMKDAHNHWNDNNYAETIKAKEAISKKQRTLLASIDKTLKKLKEMHREYQKYLEMGKR